ncbi:hypothetical protein BGX28_008798 [Mortierella sp. GBA30]|nr:hypothetical protein BGX28_008798 [Mortierella sp. GBA30]
MVWSSARAESVRAMLNAGLSKKAIQKLDRIWDRSHFNLHDVDYSRKVLTLKDLEFVWEEIEAERANATEKELSSGQKYDTCFDQTNTVLIDDSEEKAQLQPHNCIVLKTFDEALARDGTDNELLNVIEYMRVLQYQRNVSAFVRSLPYREWIDSHDSDSDNLSAQQTDEQPYPTQTETPSTPIRPANPSYIPIALQEPVFSLQPRALLVVLELNWVLLCKASDARPATPRPYLNKFLKFLLQSGCRVMVWSNDHPDAVSRMTMEVFSRKVRRRLDRVWDRDHFRLHEADYNRNVLTLKDLEFVWEDVRAQRAVAKEDELLLGQKYGMDYDQTNTVLIDCSDVTSQLQPFNSVVLRRFHEQLANAGTDDELQKVEEYIMRLQHQENVSAYMRLHPFLPHTAESQKEMFAAEVDKARGDFYAGGPKRVSRNLISRLERAASLPPLPQDTTNPQDPTKRELISEFGDEESTERQRKRTRTKERNKILKNMVRNKKAKARRAATASSAV